MPAAQLNTRIDAHLKEQGDAVLAAFDRTATDAVRSLWSHMAATKSLPPFMETEESQENRRRSRELAASGAGMAVAMARDAGLSVNLQDLTFEELREAAFEEAIAEGRFGFA